MIGSGNKKTKDSAPSAQASQEAKEQPQSKITKNPVASAKSWYSDRYQSALLQRNILIIFCVLALIGAASANFAVQEITNSKSIEPFVIEVQEKTGIATVVDQLSSKQFSANTAVANYFLVKYMRSRESYDSFNYARNYEVVRLMSAKGVYSNFRRTVHGAEGRIAKLGEHTSRKLHIKSILYQDDRTAQIRYRLEDSRVNGGVRGDAHKIALIQFEFVPNINLSMEERYINPLGFTVRKVKISDESGN